METKTMKLLLSPRLGEEIKKWRENCGKTQQELAPELGLSQQALSYIEKNSRMSRARLLHLIEKLGDAGFDFTALEEETRAEEPYSPPQHSTK